MRSMTERGMRGRSTGLVKSTPLVVLFELFFTGSSLDSRSLDSAHP